MSFSRIYIRLAVFWLMVWNYSSGRCQRLWCTPPCTLSHIHNLQLFSLSANWHSTLHRGHIWLVSRQCTWNFMDWFNSTVHMPGMKTGLWLRNFPHILSEIFLLNSTITVCHPPLYHTCCITAQEQDEKVARVMMTVTAYHIPPNIYLVYIFSSLCINCLL
jgi:hypothetical protein